VTAFAAVSTRRRVFAERFAGWECAADAVATGDASHHAVVTGSRSARQWPQLHGLSEGARATLHVYLGAYLSFYGVTPEARISQAFMADHVAALKVATGALSGREAGALV
jgi:hypothetical protein